MLYYLFNLTLYPENHMTLQALELRSFLNNDDDDDDDDDDDTVEAYFFKRSELSLYGEKNVVPCIRVILQGELT